MSDAGLRIGRLFERGSGWTFVAAFDHGPSPRVSPEGRRAPEVVSGETTGVLFSPGLPERAPRLFAFRGTPLPIVRLDFVGAAVGRG